MTLYDQNAQLWESTEVTVGEGTQEPETESFVSIDFWTMLFTLVNLLLLLAVATKFLFKPVKKMIDSRQKEIDDLYGDAEKSKSEGEDYKAEYERTLANAEAEGEEILRKATEQAKKNSDSIVKDAHNEAAAIKEKAQRDIEQERIKAINDAKNEIAGLSVQIAEKIVEREFKEEDHRKYVDQFVSDLEKSSESNS